MNQVEVGSRKGLKELWKKKSFFSFFLGMQNFIGLKNLPFERESVLRQNFGAFTAENMAMILENVTFINPWFL